MIDSIKKNKSSLKSARFVSAVVTLCFISWLLLVTKKPMPIWGDEYFTFKTALSTLPETISLVLNDTHPPLYWVIVNTVFQFLEKKLDTWIDSVVPIRILSVIFGAYAINLAANFFAKQADSDEPKLFLKIMFLLVGFSSAFILLFYPMARYYSLFTLLTVISLLLKSRKNLTWKYTAGIVIIDSLMLYTNFIAGLILFGSWIYLIRKHMRKPDFHKTLIIIIVPILAFIPLLSRLFQTIQKIGGQSFFTADFAGGLKGLVARIIYTWHVFISGEFIFPWQPSGIVMFLLAVYLIYRFIKFAPSDTKQLIGWAILMPSLLLIILSISLFSLGMEFLPPRLAFAQIFFLVAIMLGLVSIKNQKLKWALFILILLGNFHADYKMLQRQNFLHSTYIIPWNQIKLDVCDPENFNILILYDDESFQYERRFGDLRDYFTSTFNIALHNFNIEDILASNHHSKIWLIFSRKDRTPDHKLESILNRLSQPDFEIIKHHKYIEESDNAIKIKRMILGRDVEKFKKEAILFKRTEKD